RDHWRVVVVQDGPVADQEVVEVGHLLDVRRDVRVVAPEMDVVELELDDMLDRAAGRIQLTARGRAGFGGLRGERRRADRQHCRRKDGYRGEARQPSVKMSAD